MSNSSPDQDAVFAFAATARADKPVAIFVARAAGLFRSDDLGQKWFPAYQSLNLEQPLPTLAVSVSPQFARDGTVFAGVAGGILRSYNGGAEWLTTRLPEPTPTIIDIAFSPNFAEDGHVFAASLEDGVFISTSKGKEWSLWNFGLLDCRTLCLVVSPDFAEDQTLFVGTESGLYYSRTHGRSWREAESMVANAPVTSLAVSPAQSVEGSLFAGTESKGLFRSLDAGQTWQRWPEDYTGAINQILLDPAFPQSPRIVALLRDRLLISRDFGEKWGEAAVEGAGQNTAAIAPLGIAAGRPLLVGTAASGIRATTVPA